MGVQIWGYMFITVLIGIFFWFILVLYRHPKCPVCLVRFTSRRQSFFSKMAVCRLHGLFNVSYAPAPIKQNIKTLRELILDRRSLLALEDCQSGTQFIILLHDKETGSAIPIFSDQFACSAIILALENTPFYRPLTHDLFKNTLVESGIMLTKAVITGLKENTFFASVYLDKDGQEIVIDSRPSDAIALALRFNSPIFMEESLFLELLDDEYVKNLIDYIEKNKPLVPELQELDDPEDDPES